MSNRQSGTATIGIKMIPTNQLVPNQHNPRMLFDREPMEALKDSIHRNGILVPLTVYQDVATNRSVILDGQRRWMCAQELGLKQVPVNQVAPPTLVQNIVTMFQIHKLREDWELMPTALKVELLMHELKDRKDARLAATTGLDESVIVRCKKLLSFSREFQDRMLDADPDKRIKADFFIELYSVVHDRDVSSQDWFSENKFVRQMLRKYLDSSRTIKAVTDFRLIKQHITNARRIGKIKQLATRLKRFAETVDEPISSLEIGEASVRAGATGITKRAVALELTIKGLDVEKFYGEEAMWMSLIKLVRTTEAKLKDADKLR